MKNEKLTVRKICVFAVLASLSIVLAVSATVRVGNNIKVSLKFIPIFITGVLYGPLASGIVSAAGDIIGAFWTPVGPWMPQITAVEFIYGVIFGTAFLKTRDNVFYYIRAFLCALLIFFISISVMTYILSSAGYLPGLFKGMLIRLPATVITAILQFAVMCLLKKFVFFIKMKEGQKIDRL